MPETDGPTVITRPAKYRRRRCGPAVRSVVSKDDIISKLAHCHRQDLPDPGSLAEKMKLRAYASQGSVVTEAHERAVFCNNAGVPEACCDRLTMTQSFRDGALAGIVVAEAMELACIIEVLLHSPRSLQ